MGKIFKTVGLRWVPTGKIFNSSTTKVDSEPTNGSDEDITNQYEYKQTLNVSVDEEFPPDVHPHLVNVAPPRAPKIAHDSPSTATVTEDALVTTNITSPSQTSPPDSGVNRPKNTITTSGSESFENSITNEFDSEASSSSTVNVNHSKHHLPALHLRIIRKFYH
ncbi:hypothetical protein Tco_1269701, partial [Tanacetum coccineum]